MSVSRPDASNIAKHSREIFLAGGVSAEAALSAMCQIRDRLLCEYNFPFDELGPITDLITELSNESLRSDLSSFRPLNGLETL
jgi:hypothetical protein